MSSPDAAQLDLPVGKPPLLHEGEVTQDQLRKFECHAGSYFTAKKIAAAEQVAHVMGCLRDYRITDWLENDEERTAAAALDFKSFMGKVREHLLPTDWIRTIKKELNGRKQGPKETFLKFLTAVERTNSLLVNTDAHLSPAQIRSLLESNMLTDLAEDLDDDGKAAAEDDYKKWCELVKSRDNIRLRNIARLNQVAEERERARRELEQRVDLASSGALP
ncbi:hypothetical protein FB45DRAFT_860542 [Roridomyces roridus]|uniref:Uncharacterized protein n=1 Tax=Roridomyces roridus TaxID=1738132 RepID=A0AAD7CF40_9AGAR|nr:hypothetical protein FB45DRAFT_860542 [Roridomyces roridus]